MIGFDTYMTVFKGMKLDLQAFLYFSDGVVGSLEAWANWQITLLVLLVAKTTYILFFVIYLVWQRCHRNFVFVFIDLKISATLILVFAHNC